MPEPLTPNLRIGQREPPIRLEAMHRHGATRRGRAAATVSWATLVVSAVWLSAPARAEPEPVSPRWTADLPAGNYERDIWRVRGVGGQYHVQVVETGSTGPITIDPPPESVARYAPCLPERDERTPRVWWLSCVGAGSVLHAFVAHDDGLYLHVTTSRDSAAARDTVRSFSPREVARRGSEGTTLGLWPWLVLHPEHDRPLARTTSAQDWDMDEVTEVHAPGARRVTVAHVSTHAQWRARRKGTHWRKVWVLGRPVIALRVDPETVVLAFGRPLVERSLIFIWGRSPEDLERGVRLIEAATANPGQDLVRGLDEPTYHRAPKTLGRARPSFPSAIAWWLAPTSCLALLGTFVLWRRLRERRASSRPRRRRSMSWREPIGSTEAEEPSAEDPDDPERERQRGAPGDQQHPRHVRRGVVVLATEEPLHDEHASE